MASAKLHIDNLSNGYQTGKQKPVVLQEAINASLEPGQLICLLGPNGAGKSTLLRTLSGFQKPLSGNISYSGKPLESMSLRALSRQLAVVLTDRFSDRFLTAFEVVSMGRFPYASFWGQLSGKDNKIIHSTLEMLGVTSLKDEIFENLSDGEKQKMLLARALVQDTPFLFLDEPVAFVDSPGKIEIMEWLSFFAREHSKGILMTTHDIEIALDYADYLWLINREKSFKTGLPEDLVWKGAINVYFDRLEVRFDAAKGRFGVSKPTLGKKVLLKQAGAPTRWLKKALTRKGFQVSGVTDKQPEDFYITFENGAFVQYRGDELLKRFKDIEEILNQGIS
ncbi:MAG: ABC transporter ATP-binding protein [Bacteroidales bacterium]|nr:ABC transporter ATP-binding protein [Bacteroidales bacterium]